MNTWVQMPSSTRSQESDANFVTNVFSHPNYMCSLLEREKERLLARILTWLNIVEKIKLKFSLYVIWWTHLLITYKPIFPFFFFFLLIVAPLFFWLRRVNANSFRERFSKRPRHLLTLIKQEIFSDFLGRPRDRKNSVAFFGYAIITLVVWPPKRKKKSHRGYRGT